MLELVLTELLATFRHHHLSIPQDKPAAKDIHTKTQWEQEATPGLIAALEPLLRRKAMDEQPTLVSRSHKLNMNQYNSIAQSRKDITLVRDNHSSNRSPKDRSTSYRPRLQVSSELEKKILY